MLQFNVVKRLLDILQGRPDKKPRTGIYVSKTADINGLGRYVKTYLDDESYISHGGYTFDYNEDNVFIEKTDTFENFKDVIARKYEIVFVLCGGEEGEITEIINSLPDNNNMIFVFMDNRLRSYRLLDLQKQHSQLKRKAS